MEKFIFDNRYIIYSNGTIWSVRSNKFLKPRIINSGYEIICFCVNYVKVKKLIHRVVAESFIPNPDNLPQVNHINSIKTDNRVENLEWCTNRFNTNHRYKSKYPGACFNKHMKKWQANTRVNGKKKFIGYYNTPEEASNAYISYCTIHNLI
jgi:hypothetical protein